MNPYHKTQTYIMTNNDNIEKSLKNTYNKGDKFILVSRKTKNDTLVHSVVIDTVTINNYKEKIQEYVIKCAKTHYKTLSNDDTYVNLTMHKIPSSYSSQPSSYSSQPSSYPSQPSPYTHQLNNIALGTVPVWSLDNTDDARKIFSGWDYKNGGEPFYSVVESVVLHWMRFDYDSENNTDYVTVTVHGKPFKILFK